MTPIDNAVLSEMLDNGLSDWLPDQLVVRKVVPLESGLP